MAEQVGDNSGAQIRSIIERIERLEESKREITDDIKEVLSEAKGNGLDPKIIRKIVAARKKAKAARDEENELLRLYAEAINQPDLFG